MSEDCTEDARITSHHKTVLLPRSKYSLCCSVSEEGMYSSRCCPSWGGGGYPSPVLSVGYPSPDLAGEYPITGVPHLGLGTPCLGLGYTPTGTWVLGVGRGVKVTLCILYSPTFHFWVGGGGGKMALVPV